MKRICLIPFFLCLILLSPAQNAWYVAPGGDDSNAGTQAQPWLTLAHAANQVTSGDSIVLRQGVYAGDVTIATADITVMSFPGEWATVRASTTNSSEQQALWFNASGGRVLNLELEGGYFYALKFEQGNAYVSGCKVHGSGRDCIKIVPNADNITIEDCEIYDSGQRDNSNAEGVDNVNADSMVIRRCYIHDIATNGAYAKGGAIGCLFEQNLIMNCGGGILLGFFTDLQFFDPQQNPNYHGSQYCIVRNNYIIGTDGPGIGMFAALAPQVMFNTLLDVAESSRGGIHFEPVENNSQLRYVVNPIVVSNIVTLSSSASRTLVEDRNGGMTGVVTLESNRYHDQDGNPQFRYGGGVLNFATWQAQVPSNDLGSSLGDPDLDANFHLNASSPCIGASSASGTGFLDYDSDMRSQVTDIGADEYNAGCANDIPPLSPLIGTGAACDTTLVTVPASAGSAQLLVYPNPVADQVHVRIPDGAAGTLRLVDQQGRVWREIPVGAGARKRLSLAGLPAGHYLLVLQAGAERLVTPILRTRR